MKKITLTTVITLLINLLINAQQTITTYSTGYNAIEGITINSNNEVFVSEHYSGKVYSVDNATGNRIEYASTGGGYANNIIFNNNNDLFITEPYMDEIFIKNSAADATVYVDININPNSFAIDSNGNLFLSSNSKVVKINPDLTLTDYATGFLYAEGMAFDSNDNLYLADRSDRKLYKILPDGSKTVIASNIENIRGVAIDPNDKVYFTKKQTYPAEKKILKYDPSTNTITDFVTTNLETPRHIAIDNLGNMYVTDSGSETIIKISDPSLQDTTTPQIVNIPDANFKAYLVGNPNINTNGDGEIQITEAENTHSLIIRNMGISDLTGIEAFVNLFKLDCPLNQLTNLNIRQNTALRELYCSDNQLTSLDLSQNTSLVMLECGFNQLTNLDVSHNSYLIKLYCHVNPLTDLDVSNNLNLIELNCSSIRISSLDVSNNVELMRLNCSRNELSQLDVNNNTDLVALICYENNLTNLDVRYNTHLSKLLCNHNQLTSLDVNNNINLTELDCSFNQLSSLDVNHNIALTELNCEENQLAQLDISNNTNLVSFSCYENDLTNLDVSNCPNLNFLNIYHNQVANLDVSNNPMLERLICSRNLLTGLDVSENHLLTTLQCHSNYDMRYINLKNGNNNNIDMSVNYQWQSSIFGSLPNLQDVCVDALNTPLTDFITDQIGHSVNFTTDCSNLSNNDDYIQDYSVFPVPAKNILNVALETDIVKIEIYNKLGQVVITTTQNQIDISDLAKGVYFVKIKDVSGNIGIKKIMKK